MSVCVQEMGDVGAMLLVGGVDGWKIASGRGQIASFCVNVENRKNVFL
ncbi:hypothetical protein [Bartonella raoultii]|nr:hypothetical protein [Bartonella raoultii]